MKNFAYIFTILLFPFVGKSQNCFYQIDFQEAFYRDTLSFFIDDVPLFKNQVLTTLKNRGRTDLKILLVNNGKNYMVSLIPIQENNYQMTDCIKLQSNMVSIKFVVNGFVFNKTINLSAGNYIGINSYDINGDWNKKGLFIEQQDYPFYYD